MRYTAQVRLDGDELPTRLGEIMSWFGDRGLRAGPFRYRIMGDIVRVRVEFDELKNAAAFVEAFGGMVLGISDGAQAAD